MWLRSEGITTFRISNCEAFQRKFVTINQSENMCLCVLSIKIWKYESMKVLFALRDPQQFRCQKCVWNPKIISLFVKRISFYKKKIGIKEHCTQRLRDMQSCASHAYAMHHIVLSAIQASTPDAKHCTTCKVKRQTPLWSG